MLRGRGVGVALTGLGAGTWLAAEPERPARVQAYLASAARAGRLGARPGTMFGKFRQNVARFRLYRRRFLQVNTRFTAFFKIYQII